MTDFQSLVFHFIALLVMCLPEVVLRLLVMSLTSFDMMFWLETLIYWIIDWQFLFTLMLSSNNMIMMIVDYAYTYGKLNIYIGVPFSYKNHQFLIQFLSR